MCLGEPLQDEHVALQASQQKVCYVVMHKLLVFYIIVSVR